MLRYFVTLFVVCSLSLGVPLPTSGANGRLANALAALASRCESPFLVSQIRAHLNECNIDAPPYNEHQFECLLFYDINTQLCNAVAAAKLALKDDYATAINKYIDVETICTTAKNWNVTHVEEFPSFKDTVTKVFSNRIICVKVCGVEDITSTNSNFFCKYYNWGVETLQNAIATQAQVDNAIRPFSNVTTNQNESELQPAAITGNDIKPSVSNASQTEVAKELFAGKPILRETLEPSNIEEPNIADPGNVDQSGIEESAVVQPSSTNGNSNLVDRNNKDTKVHEEEGLYPQSVTKNQVPEAGNTDQVNQSLDKPSAVGAEPEKKADNAIKNDEETLNGPNLQNPVVLDPVNQKAKADPEDYQVKPPPKIVTHSEEGGADDGDEDLKTGEFSDDVKQDVNQSPKNTKLIETPFVNERGHRIREFDMRNNHNNQQGKASQHSYIRKEPEGQSSQNTYKLNNEKEGQESQNSYIRNNETKGRTLPKFYMRNKEAKSKVQASQNSYIRNNETEGLTTQSSYIRHNDTKGRTSQNFNIQFWNNEVKGKALQNSYVRNNETEEFYPNAIPDGFPDDDDHFFPFFLTAVIMVILLYVLYHNKSKVSKVFLGLVVEGRQNGRRRNSRGHAYRRLDTLEQAMSASSAAPPSKIIY